MLSNHDSHVLRSIDALLNLPYQPTRAQQPDKDARHHPVSGLHDNAFLYLLAAVSSTGHYFNREVQKYGLFLQCKPTVGRIAKQMIDPRLAPPEQALRAQHSWHSGALEQAHCECPEKPPLRRPARFGADPATLRRSVQSSVAVVSAQKQNTDGYLVGRFGSKATCDQKTAFGQNPFIKHL